MATFDEYSYRLPATWACAIMNADTSGMEDEDEKELRDFEKSLTEKYSNFTISLENVEQEPYFARSSDVSSLGGDMLDFIVLVPKKDSPRKWIIANRKTGEEFCKSFETSKECRDWIINTLDVSLEWIYNPSAFLLKKYQTMADAFDWEYEYVNKEDIENNAGAMFEILDEHEENVIRL